MTDYSGVITGARVTHRRASVDDIESAAGEDHAATVRRLLETEPVREAFALHTCNRAEVYVVTDDPADGRRALTGFGTPVPEHVVRTGHEESLRHLLRVAAGLESLVLGEDQILGQVRDAYEAAREAGGIGPVMEEGVTKAIHVGERARTETAINEGVVSLGSAAVELADAERGLAGAAALVVGAGEMGALAVNALDDADVAALTVANRTVRTAEHVAEDATTPADAVGLSALPAAVASADVVVTATGSREPVIDGETAAGAGDTLVIDIARPRDVAPAVADEPGVTLRDLDDIEAVTEETRRERREAAEAVEDIVEDEFDRLLDQYKRKRADAVIAAMHEGAEFLKEREIETAISRLEARREVDEEDREIIESLADALVGQLLATPTHSLREAAAEDDWSTINTALQLFDPEPGPSFGREPPEFVTADGMDDGGSDGGDGSGGSDDSGDKPAGVPDLPPDASPEDLPDAVPDHVVAELRDDEE